MTTCVAILNRQGVALAADSAATVSSSELQTKIYNSANKLFTLSKYQPVGVMIYGSASLMGVPWETVIKVYREQLDGTSFATLEDYARHFVEFLQTPSYLFPQQHQDDYVVSTAYSYFYNIVTELESAIQAIIMEEGEFDESKLPEVLSSLLSKEHEDWQQEERLENFPESFTETFTARHKERIDTVADEMFQQIPLSENDLLKLTELVSFLFSRNRFRETLSGIVISGFGNADAFPALVEMHFECIVDGILKFKYGNNVEVNVQQDASIIPFAQGDMIATFVEGTDPNYLNVSRVMLSSIFAEFPLLLMDSLGDSMDEEQRSKLQTALKEVSENLFHLYMEKMQQYRLVQHIRPVINVVSVLPKDELASLAETLVNLTSVKRRVSFDAETVGGPVDVAVISKGDGFTWIKRKYYFRSQMNPMFFQNYFGGES